jgi:2-keto-4-pentenoate hydratase/2-oxohepta-3-ene-1,7-dioic acid hydratase in catechol pathway
MYDKPMAPQLWSYAEVAEHWDQLTLRAWADGELYQEASVASMLTPAELIAAYTGGSGGLAEGTAMFSGTISTKGGLRPAERFRFELEDPVLGRALRHEYSVRSLPIVG